MMLYYTLSREDEEDTSPIFREDCNIQRPREEWIVLGEFKTPRDALISAQMTHRFREFYLCTQCRKSHGKIQGKMREDPLYDVSKHTG